MHELNVTTKETVELDIKTQLIIIIHKRWVVVVVVDSRISWVASPPSPSFTMIAGRREDGENEIFKEIPWGGVWRKYHNSGKENNFNRGELNRNLQTKNLGVSRRGP